MGRAENYKVENKKGTALFFEVREFPLLDALKRFGVRDVSVLFGDVINMWITGDGNVWIYIRRV